jgi:hypothetical protein
MHKSVAGSFAILFVLGACSSSSNPPSSSSGGGGTAKDPAMAPIVAVDRFSDAFAHLFKRSANPAFPAPNAPIDFDQGAFITQGFGPAGEKITYYNFDVLPAGPAPIYVFFREGSATELTEQLHIVDVLPGDQGYNDFWQVTKVTVPASYVANSVTSLAEIRAAGFALTPTNMLVNCPVVPDGSTARLRYTSQESTSLVDGWYRGQVVKYFSFLEHMLMMSGSTTVPIAPIYVTFNINPGPGNPTGGPPSGFETVPGSMQTHNVASVLPEDSSYSPLWMVSVYDNGAFASVSDLATATVAPVLNPNAGLVNCPIVGKSVGDAE